MSRSSVSPISPASPQNRTERLLGAGIGGLALAMALYNKGISFTLYEEAKEYSAIG
jgi:hypothetical protein